MERNTGTENRGKHNLLVYKVVHRCCQRSCNLLFAVLQMTRYLIGHYLAYTFKVATETQHIVLNIHIAQFAQILADKRRCLCKIYYLHKICYVKSCLIFSISRFTRFVNW